MEPDDRWQMFVSDCPLGNRNTTDSASGRESEVVRSPSAPAVPAVPATPAAALDAFSERQILTSLKHSSQNLLVFTDLYVGLRVRASVSAVRSTLTG